MRLLRRLAFLHGLLPFWQQNRHQQLRFRAGEGWRGKRPLQLGTGGTEQTQTMLGAGFQGEMQ